MEDKSMTIANFNIVFGEKEEPLLDYFDTVLLPAFNSSLIRSKGDSEYILMNIKVSEISKDDFVITGIIVKKTVLEVFTKFDEQENFIKTKEYHPTAPFSVFIIYLKNHRMILVRNQKGSPNILTFSATVKYIMNKYIHDENRKRKRDNIQYLPYPIINIVGIPIKESIEEALKKVKKINKLTLKLYPLNGDIDFSGFFDTMSTDLRKAVDSKTGALTLNSPNSVSGITEVLTAAEGTIEPIISVTYPDKSNGKIYNGSLSENMKIQYDDTDIDTVTSVIISKTKDLKSIKNVSDGNQQIYSKNLNKIKPFKDN